MLSHTFYDITPAIPSELIAFGTVPGGERRNLRLHIDKGILVTGERGSGKTVNLESICESASRAGYSVVRLSAGWTAAGFRQSLKTISPHAGSPTLLVFDELHLIGRSTARSAIYQALREKVMGGGVALLASTIRPEDVPAELHPVVNTWINMDEPTADGMPRVRSTARVTHLDEFGEFCEDPTHFWDQANLDQASTGESRDR